MRDGRLEARLDEEFSNLDPDDPPGDPTLGVLRDVGEEAISAAGYDLTPDLSESIYLDAEHLAGLKSSALLAGTPFGCREEEDAARTIEAIQDADPEPRWEPAPQHFLVDFLIPHRPLMVRRGRERRFACNTHAKGGRRASGSSPPKSGDDPPGEPPGIAAPPRRGPLHAARIGGAK